MADIFDVVADTTRRDLLQLLLATYTSTAAEGGELSVGQIVGRLSLSQPTVSKQLKVLRDHGLVSVRDEGQHRYYSLNAAPLEDLEDWLIPFLSADFDPSSIDPEDTDVAPLPPSSPGAEMGQRVGRAVAERSYRARSTLEAAQKRINGGIHRFTGR
jgi:ArsR family transcriptional regulator